MEGERAVVGWEEGAAGATGAGARGAGEARGARAGARSEGAGMHVVPS